MRTISSAATEQEQLPPGVREPATDLDDRESHEADEAAESISSRSGLDPSLKGQAEIVEARTISKWQPGSPCIGHRHARP
jgi:hypothetical protein